MRFILVLKFVSSFCDESKIRKNYSSSFFVEEESDIHTSYTECSGIFFHIGVTVTICWPENHFRNISKFLSCFLTYDNHEWFV